MKTTAPALPSVSQHFSKSDSTVRDIYERILSGARAWGPVEEDPKKTSIRLV